MMGWKAKGKNVKKFVAVAAAAFNITISFLFFSILSSFSFATIILTLKKIRKDKRSFEVIVTLNITFYTNVTLYIALHIVIFIGFIYFYTVSWMI